MSANIQQRSHHRNAIHMRRYDFKPLLSQPITDAISLISAIQSYNGTIRNMDGLHMFLESRLTTNERRTFFDETLPAIINMAKSWPDKATIDIPLHAGKNNELYLSQDQVASLLANAFLCTFSKRPFNYPTINFDGLYQQSGLRQLAQFEKLQCILNYFEKRNSTNRNQQQIRYRRISLAEHQLPYWASMSKRVTTKHIASNKRIEDKNHQRMIQTDFANAFVGGGVLTRGCLQEEIRFITSPELIAARLFTEKLQDNEAVIIEGFEEYSAYKGYASRFKFVREPDRSQNTTASYIPLTLTAIDALNYRDPKSQYEECNIRRDLNKAFSGFYKNAIGEGKQIVTGNWGCGAYKGNPQLKSIIQLMAASLNDQQLIYSTFGNKQQEQEISKIYTLILNKNLTIGTLYKLLITYDHNNKNTDLYTHISRNTM